MSDTKSKKYPVATDLSPVLIPKDVNYGGPKYVSTSGTAKA
jgi:hypothetical protein